MEAQTAVDINVVNRVKVADGRRLVRHVHQRVGRQQAPCPHQTKAIKLEARQTGLACQRVLPTVALATIAMSTTPSLQQHLRKSDCVSSAKKRPWMTLSLFKNTSRRSGLQNGEKRRLNTSNRCSQAARPLGEQRFEKFNFLSGRVMPAQKRLICFYT
jgi:hypothetical protein